SQATVPGQGRGPTALAPLTPLPEARTPVAIPTALGTSDFDLQGTVKAQAAQSGAWAQQTLAALRLTATAMAQTGPGADGQAQRPILTPTGPVAQQADLNTASAATQTAGVAQTWIAATLLHRKLEIEQTQTAMAQTSAAQAQVAVGATQTFTA